MSTPSRPEWWQSFFHGAVTEFWRRFADDALTEREVEGVLRLLALERGERVLDVPCGNGRHALALARRGFSVQGIDLAAEFIAQARAHAHGLDASFTVGDMRELPWPERFDAACCLGNSFGYFEEDHDHARFVRAVAMSLRPGGRFLLEAACLEVLLPQFQRSSVHSAGGLEMRREARYDAARGRVITSYAFTREGAAPQLCEASHRLFTFRQLEELLRASGFAEVRGVATLDGAPFELGAQRLYLLARRPG